MASQAISNDAYVEELYLYKDQLHAGPLTFKQSSSYGLF